MQLKHLLHLTFAGVVFFPSAISASPQARFTVGVIAPLSGPVAPMGDAFRRGFERFEKEHPSCASQATLKFEDGKYDGKATSTAFKKLVAADRVDFTIVWGNTPASVVAPIAESKKAPLLAIAFKPEAKGRSHVITFGPKTKDLAAKIAAELRAWNLKRPAAVTVNIGDALAGIDHVKDFLGGDLDVRVVALEEGDFRTILTQLRAKGVDGMIAFLLPDQALNFAKQAAEIHFTPPIIGGDVFADVDFGGRVSAYLPRLAFVYGAVDPDFTQRIKQRPGGSSYLFEIASGYTMGELSCTLAEMWSKNHDLNLIDAIKTVVFKHSPIVGLRLGHDEEYGLHFENEARIYYVSGRPTD